MAIICVDLSQPEKVLVNVESWIKIWQDFLTKHAFKLINIEQQNELIKKVEDYVRTYRVPEFDEEGRLLTQF